jgi:U4/U6.U5 tri-snRNP-associated protein 2
VKKESGAAPVIERTESKSKFMFLTLDLPPAPLFREDSEKNIIPQVSNVVAFLFVQLMFLAQVPLMVLLEKFDGNHWTEFPVELTRKQYHLSKIPPFLVLLVTRFKKNRFFVEKNPTIVTFPVKNLDLAPYVKGATQVLKKDKESVRFCF